MNKSKVFLTNHALIQNANIEELPDILINMIWELCEDGMVTREELFDWLNYPCPIFFYNCKKLQVV